MQTLPRFLPGDRITAVGDDAPAYEIVRHLGTGGAGRAYLATALATGEPVVVKTPRTWKVVHDLFHEARSVLREDWPHVARLRGIDAMVHRELACDLPFVVMDAYRGSLFQRLCDQPLVEPSRALRWIRDCARGLQASQLVHRDLKPENILLDHQDRAWVCDFGLAVPANPRVRQRQGIRISGVMGTMMYMPPEQIIEADDIDERADIYALGLILYEMLAGRTAHPRYDATRLSESGYLAAVHDHQVAWQDVPHAAAAEIVRVCTAKRRRDRFADYWALLNAIEDAIEPAADPDGRAAGTPMGATAARDLRP